MKIIINLLRKHMLKTVGENTPKIIKKNFYLLKNIHNILQ